MTWLRCKACEHVFTDGYWPPDALAEIFKNTHAFQTVGNVDETARAIAAKLIDTVTPYVSSGTWLDIGFGNGALLFTAKEYGFEPIGLELRKGAAAAMQSRGVTAYEQDFCSFEATGECGFSVISMADVLEHMPFPKLVLEAAARALRQDGALFLSMPNMSAPIWDCYDAQDGGNPYWAEIEHYHNFTRERLYALLRETGFTPVKYGVSARYIACMEVIARPTTQENQCPTRR